MSFKLNDYNAFLSSLVERDKDSVIPMSPDLQVEEEQITDGKLPIDFDFCLYDKNVDDKKTSNFSSGGINESNIASQSSNRNDSTRNPSLPISISPRSQENPFNEDNDQVIDKLMKDKLEGDGSKFDNFAFLANRDVFVKQESSDDDLLSPDLEVSDSFYTGFRGTNDGYMMNKDDGLKKTTTIDSLSSLSNSISNSFSMSNTTNGLPNRGPKQVSAVEMQQSSNKYKCKVPNQRQKSSANFKALDDRDDMMDEAFDSRNRDFRPRMRSSHNVIEQRYRNKINDKFTALQNSVPTLRIVAKRKQKHEDIMDDDPLDPERYELSESDADDLEGLEPARKLNKGIILSKSIEYIKFLELKNNRMRQQQSELIEKAKLLGIAVDELQF